MNRPSVDQCPQTIAGRGRRGRALRTTDRGPAVCVPGRALGIERDAPARRAIAHAREHVDDRAVAIDARELRRPQPGGRRTCSSAACGSRRRAGAARLRARGARRAIVVHFGARPACTIIQPSSRSTCTSGCIRSQSSSTSPSSANSTRCRSAIDLRLLVAVAFADRQQRQVVVAEHDDTCSRAASAPGAAFPAIRRRG